MSQFTQLLAVQRQYIVQDAVDAISAVQQLTTNIFGPKHSEITTVVEHKQYTALNVNLYVQKLNPTDYLIFVTTKLNMKS